MDAMQEPRAQRTLVKSPPELWAELSDIDALARHLGEFGEIRITRLDPETTVAWEGDRACGTVALEPSGWGTKVTITATLAEEVVAEPVVVEPEPVEPSRAGRVEPEAGARARAGRRGAASPSPSRSPRRPGRHRHEAPKVGFFARLFGRRRKVEAAVEVEPEPVPRSRPSWSPSRSPSPSSPSRSPGREPEPVAVEPEPEPQPAPLDVERAEAILTGVLDDLGSAHHRPFSRS